MPVKAQGAPAVHLEGMDLRPPLPKEHGAWAQLALTTGAVALAVPAHPAGLWAWMGALGCGFLAHEPLLVLLGQRGTRARNGMGRRSWIWLVLLLAGGAALGVLGWRTAPAEARASLLLPFLGAALLLPGILRGREKSLAGEALAAVALAGAALPLALRAELPRGKAAALAGGLMLAFVLGTLLVRRFLAERRKRPEPFSALGAALLTGLGGVAGLALLMRGGIALGLACLPLPLLGLRLFAGPWPPHRLKRLGWALALGNLATALLLAFSLR